jgi:hypothetical protein
MGFVYWRVVEDVPGARLVLQRSDDRSIEHVWDRDARALSTRRRLALGRSGGRTVPFDAMRRLSFTVFPEGGGPYLVLVDLVAPGHRPLRGPMIFKGVESRPAALEVLFKIARVIGWVAYRVRPAHARGVTVDVGPEALDASHPYRDAAADLLEPAPHARPVPPAPGLEAPSRSGRAEPRFREPDFPVETVAEGWRIGRWRLVRWTPEAARLFCHEGGIWRWLGRFRRQYSRRADYDACFDFARGTFAFRSGRTRDVTPIEDVASLRLRAAGTARQPRWALEVVRAVGRVTVAETDPGEDVGSVAHGRALALLVGLARAIDRPWSIVEGERLR